MGCCHSKTGNFSLQHDAVAPITKQPIKDIASTKIAPARNGAGVPKAKTAQTDSCQLVAEDKKSYGSFQLPEVEIVRVPDGEGTPITLGKLFGVWTAPMPTLVEQIMRVQKFTFDDTDVILLGYPKSGTHWMWEMLQMLVKGKAEYSRIPKEKLLLSFTTQEFFDTLTPPRVFNCHAPFFGLPPFLKEGRSKCRMVYILRNPKDVAVSYYHHLMAQTVFEYEGNFHGFLDLFIEGKVPGDSWFDYVLGWEKTLQEHPELPLLVLHYEDIKEDVVSALRKVSHFLGLGRGEELLKDIATQCTIHKMKEVDEGIKDHSTEYLRISKTGKNFIYRKGEVGDWKNYFSAEDNARFDEVMKSKMSNSALRFRFDLSDRSTEL